MQREILHKRMGNNDINVDLELQNHSANQLIFCIWPLHVSFHFASTYSNYEWTNGKKDNY